MYRVQSIVLHDCMLLYTPYATSLINTWCQKSVKEQWFNYLSSLLSSLTMIGQDGKMFPTVLGSIWPFSPRVKNAKSVLYATLGEDADNVLVSTNITEDE